MIFHIIFIDQLTNQKGGLVHRSLQPAHQIPGTCFVNKYGSWYQICLFRIVFRIPVSSSRLKLLFALLYIIFLLYRYYSYSKDKILLLAS